MHIDGELLDAFVASCQEQLGNIELHVLALEGGAEGPDHIGAIFRAAHSIKADAAAMGFDRISEFSHAVEDVLELVRGRRLDVSRPLADALLEAFDCLQHMVRSPLQEPSPDVAPSLMRLNKLLCAALSAGRGGDAVCQESGPNAASPPDRARVEGDARIQHLTIPAARLDVLVDQVGELAGVHSRLASVAGESGPLCAVEEDLARAVGILREQVMGLRLVPLKPMFAKFRRLARDVASETGKQVEFFVAGEDTTLDKSAVEKVQVPLAHIIRNAVDHGLESRESRLSSGKDGVGRVWMSARQQGAEVEISVRDDGRGIDRERLLRTARERGLLPQGSQGDELRLVDLVCLPGLSSADRVSAHSGRGVGMDAARNSIHDMRGTLELSSVPGHGSTAVIRVPLSLAMLDCLEVLVGGERFFIQLPSVEECLEAADISSRGRGVGFQRFRDGLLPVVSLAGLFDMAEAGRKAASVVVVRSGEDRFGIIVDGIVGHRQIVLKPLARAVGRPPGILGCTVAADGRMALVLDVAAVARLCRGCGEPERTS